MQQIRSTGTDRYSKMLLPGHIDREHDPGHCQKMTLQKCVTYKCQAFGIEDDGFQEVFVQEVIKENTRMGLYANIRGINHCTNRQGRIESLQSLTYGTRQRHTVIRFRSDWESACPHLVTQLLWFPLTNEHDDAPDALEGAV